MKLTLSSLVFIGSLLCFTACKKTTHGCVDSNATNYDQLAEIDNNSCCFNCYDEVESFIGEYCGNEVPRIVEDGYTFVNVHVWTLNGEFVFPETTGAVPAFNADLTPVIMHWHSEVTCY